MGGGRRRSVGPGLSGGPEGPRDGVHLALLRLAIEADDAGEVERLLLGGGAERGAAAEALAMSASRGAARCAGALAAALTKDGAGLSWLHAAIREAVGGGHAATFGALAPWVRADAVESGAVGAASRARTDEMLGLVLHWIGRPLGADEVAELLWLSAGEGCAARVQMALALPGAAPWAVSASGCLAMEALARKNEWTSASEQCVELLAQAMARVAGPARMAAMAARMEGVVRGLAASTWGPGAVGAGASCFGRLSDRWLEAGELIEAAGAWPRRASEERPKAL